MAKEHDGGDTGSEESAREADLPDTVVEKAERLTRRARDAVDPKEAAAYRDRRDELLGEHAFTSRIREDDDAVLVLHPQEWVEDGTVRPERIEDVDRGIEIPLEGTADPDDWESVHERNRALAAEVEAEHGETHGANARELADFMSNHYAKPLTDATEEELTEFLTEYYPRNVWPTDDQKTVVEESVRLVRDRALTERRR